MEKEMNQSTIKLITPLEMFNLQKDENTIILYDVRTPAEYRELHAKGVMNMPLDKLETDNFKDKHNTTIDTPLYFICKSGNRGQKACEKFLKAGFGNIYNVEGGTDAWEERGLPIILGEKSISLERQVRIAAGFLVLLGMTLGFFVHQAFYSLSAFVGGGLIFAGITDICSMGIMLSKMPWNK